MNNGYGRTTQTQRYGIHLIDKSMDSPIFCMRIIVQNEYGLSAYKDIRGVQLTQMGKLWL